MLIASKAATILVEKPTNKAIPPKNSIIPTIIPNSFGIGNPILRNFVAVLSGLFSFGAPWDMKMIPRINLNGRAAREIKNSIATFIYFKTFLYLNPII